LRDDVNEALE
jgi:hypothetical protein